MSFREMHDTDIEGQVAVWEIGALGDKRQIVFFGTYAECLAYGVDSDATSATRTAHDATPGGEE